MNLLLKWKRGTGAAWPHLIFLKNFKKWKLIWLHRQNSTKYVYHIERFSNSTLSLYEWAVTEHWHNSLTDWSFCCLGWSRVSMKAVKNPPPIMLWQRSTSTATTTQNVSWERTHTTTAVWLESTVRRETPICPVLPMRGDSVTRSWSM